MPDTDQVNQSVSSFINNNGNWDEMLIQSELAHVLPNSVIQDILSIELPRNKLTDRLYWGPSNTGWFSTKSATTLIPNGCRDYNFMCKWIWKLDVPPKVRHFLWKISRNGLPTKHRLQQSHVSVPLECVFCDCQVETTNHILLDCRVTKQLLLHLGLVLPTNKIFDFELTKPNLVLHNIWKGIGEKRFCKLAIAWWVAWYFRNQIAFQHDQNITLISIKVFLLTFIQKWEATKNFDFFDNDINLGMTNQDCTLSNSGSVSNSFQKRDQLLKWDRPPHNYVKLNFDGSKLDSGTSSYGFVIRDMNASVVALGGSTCGNHSIVYAEALGLWKGVQRAKDLGIKHMLIEGDNLCIIKTILGDWKPPGNIELLQSDTMMELLSFSNVSIRHVFRKVNTVADKIAHLAYSIPAVGRFEEDPELQVLILRDALGWKE